MVLVYLVLCGACIAVRMCHVVSIDMLESIYFAFFHSVRKYGVFFFCREGGEWVVVVVVAV